MGRKIIDGEEVTLDVTDKKILFALFKDGRALIKDVSDKTSIPRDVVKYRMDRLVKKGVIRYFSPLIDPARLGYPVCTWVQFVFQNFDPKEHQKFVAYLQNHQYVFYSAKVTGRFNFMIGLQTKDLDHFEKVLGGILQQFNHLIKEYSSSSLIEEFKRESNLLDDKTLYGA